IKKTRSIMTKFNELIQEELVRRHEDKAFNKGINSAYKFSVVYLSEDVFTATRKRRPEGGLTKLEKAMGTKISVSFQTRAPDPTIIRLTIADKHAGANVMHLGQHTAMLQNADFDGDIIANLMAGDSLQDIRAIVDMMETEAKNIAPNPAEFKRIIAERNEKEVLRAISKVASRGTVYARDDKPLNLDLVEKFLTKVDLAALEHKETGKRWSDLDTLVDEIAESARFLKKDIADAVVIKPSLPEPVKRLQQAA
ncbi:unnamed protein product, partial [marine sediment metagenome]